MSPGNRRTDSLQILGLAHRAGAVIRGLDAVRTALRAGRVSLVVTADDASVVQLKKIEGLLKAREVPSVSLGSRAALGAALGSPPLTAVAVAGTAWAERLRVESAHAAAPDGPGREQGRKT